MSLLTICQDVADEIGLLRPSAIVGESDLTARRLLAAAKAEGEGLYRAHDWSILQKEHSFETTASDDNYAVPADFGRIITDTAWDRDAYRKMRGSLSPQQWQFQRSALVSNTAFRRRWRILVGQQTGSVLIDPTPTATGEELVYEYVSKYWCSSSGGTAQATWAADGDLFLIDDELLRAGLLWRMKRSLGQPYADERADAEDLQRKAIVADLAMPIMNMAPPRVPWPQGLIPEGDWPAS